MKWDSKKNSYTGGHEAQKCEKCTAVFYDKNTLDSHVKNMHHYKEFQGGWFNAKSKPQGAFGGGFGSSGDVKPGKVELLPLLIKALSE
jgi:uncharacterized C2H2 Zn-finger protein